MTTDATAPTAEETWNEVAAERAGIAPVKSAEKPTTTPAAAEPVTEAKPDVRGELDAFKADIEAKYAEKFRKLEGQFGNVNGETQRLKAELEAAKAAAKSTDGPSNSEIKEAITNPQEWDDLKSKYPEWATAHEKLLDARIAANFDAKAFEAAIKRDIQGQTEAVRKEIIDSALDAVYPGWKAEVNTDGFKQWFEGQSDEVKALTNSPSVGDAAKMLRLYEASKQSNPANQITEQRKATLAAAAGAPKGVRSTTPQKSVSDMTPAELWEYEKRQRTKRG